VWAIFKICRDAFHGPLHVAPVALEFYLTEGVANVEAVVKNSRGTVEFHEI
jgi:hypothetical protein